MNFFYQIYQKYWDTLIIYRNFLTFYYPLMCLKTTELVANSVDPDRMPHSVAADQGLQLFSQVCPNSWVYTVI